MKHQYFIALMILLSSIFACEPPVTFKEPQPLDIENLTGFPKRLQGEYISLSDNSTLIITNKLIQRIYDFDEKIHKSQIDSNYIIKGDTIINFTYNGRGVIKREGDSVIIHVHDIDTMFQMDYDNVVRKFKGYYFLNKRYDKESWEVKKLQYSKGELIVSSITSNKDIENLKIISESYKDTAAPYKFSITKKQFKEFVKNNGFADSEQFIRKK